ncbi:Prefoldin subunit beta [uncultured archaeon]|nr:Prefoldin subunit beta [uncultured archaeon]
MSLPKEAQENVQRLQMLEQNLQALNMQKQQFQAQLFEIESALKEVTTAPSTYKIVGGIMIGTDKNTLQKELDGKKEILNLRLQTIEKQEKQLKEKATKLQEEVLASVKG